MQTVGREHRLQRRADAGHTSAMNNLGVLLGMQIRQTWPVLAAGGRRPPTPVTEKSCDAV